MARIERVYNRSLIDSINVRNFSIAALRHERIYDREDIHRPINIETHYSPYDLSIHAVIDTEVEVRANPDFDW